MRLLALVALVISTFAIDLASATPNCRQCPYTCNDLGLGKKDCSAVSETRGICCLDLSKKGLEMAAAQEAALKDKTTSAATVREQCPSGFRPSEQKCSPAERAKGCKDVRLSSGLGCVKR